MSVDRQARSRRLNDAKQQDLLTPQPRADRRPKAFTLDEVRHLKSESDAIRMSVERSPFETKEIPLLFQIDAGQWSNILSGAKHFPHNRRNEFMDFVGNEILLIYAAESRGYDFSTMRKHQSDLEEKLEAAEQRIAELEKKDEIKTEFLRQVMGKNA